MDDGGELPPADMLTILKAKFIHCKIHISILQTFCSMTLKLTLSEEFENSLKIPSKPVDSIRKDC